MLLVLYISYYQYVNYYSVGLLIALWLRFLGSFGGSFQSSFQGSFQGKNHPKKWVENGFNYPLREAEC